jgi:hypothetical protein
MNFFKESGIALTEDIKKDIQEGVKAYKNPHAFATAWGIPWSSFNYLCGNGGRERKQIAWDAWPPIRRYLESIGRIKKGDIEWFTPSELRELAKNKTSSGLSDDEKTMLSFFRTLNADGRKAAINSVKGLAVVPSLSNSGLNSDKTA